MRWILWSAGVLCILLMILGIKGLRWYLQEPWQDQLNQMIAYQQPSSSKFYDDQDQLIWESYSTYHHSVPLDEMPSSLIEAVIAIEDQHFFSHRGVDFSAIIRAGWHNIRTMKVSQGGSTITQQLVRYHLLTRKKKYARKLKEVILAWKLEQILSKKQILEMYLNHLFLGQNAHGVGGVAQRFFSKPLSDLELHEQAFIAGLFQAPSRYNPLKNIKLARRRQVAVLRAMLRQKKISSQTFKTTVKKPLRYRPHLVGSHTRSHHHLYIIDYARQQAEQILQIKNLKNKGYRIYTTLNTEVSDLLAESIAQMDSAFTKIETLNDLDQQGGSLQAAATVFNLRTGTIEAMVGGRDYRTSRFNRSFQAQRSAGSVFKPVTYSYALSRGYQWSDVFYLSPITLAGTYRPRSSRRDYLTETTLLRAFTSSINVTTLEVGKTLGMDALIQHAKQLGVRSPIKKEYGSIIGQSEVNQLDLLRMYSTFANQGKMIEPSVISKIVDSQGRVVYQHPSVAERSVRVLSAEISFLMVKAMSSVLSHGTGHNAYHLARVAAGKTGTSNDSIDNWFCGFTADYLTVVWVGSESHQPLLKGRGSGASLALPIWNHTMTSLTQRAQSQPFPIPSGVKRYSIDGRYGHATKGGYEAWFLAQHSPPQRPSYLKLINSSRKALRGFGKQP